VAASQTQLVAHLLDLLEGWGPVEARRMFSGHGLFRGGAMFAIVAAETAYFKTDAENRAAYEAAAMPPFRYTRRGKSIALTFHAVPSHLLDEAEELAAWAEGAWAAALRARRRRKHAAATDRSGTDPG
jgi:DNA transformation protein